MRKSLLFVFWLITTCAYAQNKYIYITDSKTILSGGGTEKKVYVDGSAISSKDATLGSVLNQYKDKGFYVDKMCITHNSSGSYRARILLKESNSNEISSYIVFISGVDQFGELSGDIPSSLSDLASQKSTISTTELSRTNIGDIINELTPLGYEVDQFCAGGSLVYTIFARKGNGNENATRNIESKKEIVREMKRYNLQGMPVKANAKGYQIVVYSDYSTKTIFVK